MNHRALILTLCLPFNPRYEDANPDLEDVEDTPDVDPETLRLYRVLRFFSTFIRALIERCKTAADAVS